jgi:DNA polymerase-4
MAKYVAIGREVRTMMRDLTPLVEPLSIDEAFLDLSGTQELHKGSAARSLAGLALRIEEEIDITVSIGLSANKSLAKIASDLDKPRGFAVIGGEEAQAFLAKRPVSLIFGVGRAFEKKLVRDGFRLIGDLAAVPEAELVARYGAIGERLANFSRGTDARAVTPGRQAKSVSSETTFAEDSGDRAVLKGKLWRQCERVARRLREKEFAGRTVVLKLKTHDFQIITRRRTLTVPTQLAAELYEATAPLLERELSGRSFRLLGVGTQDLVPGYEAETGDLFGSDQRRVASLERAMDDLHARFGDNAPVKGRGLGAGRRKKGA